MKKRIIAFYDLLLYAIICGPLLVIAINLLFMLLIKGTHEWVYENWFLVVVFAVTFVLSLVGTMLLRHCTIKNGSVEFKLYFAFLAATWEKFNANINSIDERWNNNFFISEVKDIKVVRLTEEEKRTKVYYRHWFNKYLKIELKYGKSKYVYVGNYAGFQIRAIIKLLKCV